MTSWHEEAERQAGRHELCRCTGAKRLIRQAVQDEVILHEVNISMQRHLWLTAVALHEAYGFSEKRLDKFFDAFQAAANELQKMIDEVDQDYAYEKLRLRAEEISKRDIVFYEDEVYQEYKDARLECELEAEE